MKVFDLNYPAGSSSALQVMLPQRGESSTDSADWDTSVVSIEQAVEELSVQKQSVLFPVTPTEIPPGSSAKVELDDLDSALLDGFTVFIPMLLALTAADTWSPIEQVPDLDLFVNTSSRQLRVQNNGATTISVKGLVWFIPTGGITELEG